MISIIIPVYNQHEMTAECITAIREQTRDFELIIVDNGSEPAIKPPFTGFTETTLIRNEKNEGFPVAVNQGIRAANGDVVILLNNDCFVTPRWSERLTSWLDEFSIVSPMTNYCAGMQQVTIGSYDNLDELNKEAEEWAEEYAGMAEEVNWVIGFCMAFRKSLFWELGPFDEGLWPCCGEEVDFCLRARAAGHKVGIAHDTYVHHEGSQTFSAMDKAELIKYGEVNNRNLIHLAKKWGADLLQSISVGKDNDFFRSFKDKYKDESAWIIGKGPSLANLKASDIGDGPVITLNDSILTVEALDLPNPIFSMQKDGGDRRKRPISNLCPDCDYSDDCGDQCGAMNRPKKATLLLHEHESKYCFPDYPDRHVLDWKDFGLPGNVFSSILAIKTAQLMGCNKFNFISCDAHTNGNCETYGVISSVNYLDYQGSLSCYLKNLDYLFITPSGEI